MLLAACAGCDPLGLNEGCDFFAETPLRVAMEGPVELSTPTPVMLAGVRIGHVRAVELTADNRPELRVCVQSEYVDNLRRMTIFYVDRTSPTTTVQAEPEDGSGPVDLAAEPLVFPGFSSYEAYTAWRAENFLRQGMETMFKAFGKLLGPRAPQPPPESSPAPTPSPSPESDSGPKTL